MIRTRLRWRRIHPDRRGILDALRCSAKITQVSRTTKRRTSFSGLATATRFLVFTNPLKDPRSGGRVRGPFSKTLVGVAVADRQLTNRGQLELVALSMGLHGLDRCFMIHTHG